ncbi:hypothetical protein D3C73_1494690 [compost metagenome]
MFHFAYSVIPSSGTVSVVKFHACVNASSLYQSAKVKPSNVGTAGATIFEPKSAVIAVTRLPPLLSKLTVYWFASYCALTVKAPVTLVKPLSQPVNV